MNSFDFCQEALKYEKLFPETKKNSKGLTGLLNLSNTCYMNSAFQCLSNTPELITYFLNGAYSKDIQPENLSGTKGDSAYAFAILIRRLWLEKEPFISPNFMKVLFQKHPQLSMYSRNEQHDSQEFLHAIIDVLNEDLKKARKDTSKNKEKNGSWMSFLWSNSSIIMQLFFGVLKSTLTCPECELSSSNFEPFLNLSLHFPISTEKSIGSLLYFREAVEEDCKLVTFDSNILEYIPGQFKDQIKINEKINNEKYLTFVIIYKYASAMLFENDFKNIKEIMFNNKGGSLGIYETNDKLKVEEGLYSLVFTRNERRANIYDPLNIIKLIKLNRKSGSVVINQIILTNLQKLLSKLHFSNYGCKKLNIKLKLLDKLTLLSICEKCHEINFCRCPLEFPLLNNIEIKYRHTDYQLYFEICFEWDNLTKFEQDGILTISETFNRFNNNLMNFPKKSLTKNNTGFTIYDFLKHFSDPETLCSQNAWFCNKCKKNQRATTQMEIFSAPRILIIHLKRFKNNRNIKTKINLKIQYPLENLDLTDYILENLLPEELLERKDVKSNENSKKTPILYDLYGVINHHGSNLSCGHYTAICRNSCDLKWYKFDDKLVYEIGESQVCNNDAYVLFYRRRT